jgi:hypothetical protein
VLPSHKHWVSYVAVMHAMLMIVADDDDDGDAMDGG